MTRSGSNVVRLSVGNWVAIAALCVSVLATVGGIYQSHDRKLISIEASQAATEARLDQLESDLLAPTVALASRLRDLEARAITEADAARLEASFDKRMDELLAYLVRIEGRLHSMKGSN